MVPFLHTVWVQWTRACVLTAASLYSWGGELIKMNMSPTWTAWRVAARDWTPRRDPSGCRQKEGGVTWWLMIGVSVKIGLWNALLERERESSEPWQQQNNTKMMGETRCSKTCHGHYFLMRARRKKQVFDITETPSDSLCSPRSVHVQYRSSSAIDLIKTFL